MSLRIYKPALPLSQYVEFMWRATRAGMTTPSRERVYPNGGMSLVIYLDRPTASFYIDHALLRVQVPLLAGPYSRSFEFDPSQSTSVVGVAFRPGAGRLFFYMAAHELHNTDVALSGVHPGEADCLLNDVCSATNELEQFLTLERYLNRKLENAAPTHPAVWHALEQLSRQGGVRSVRKIQTDTGLSHTRFIQLFREHVGLTPKLFCRVQRFRTLLDRLDKGMLVNWAELAADCGYFDQAHLIHDFRAFASMTPLEYRRVTSRVESDSENLEKLNFLQYKLSGRPAG